MAAAPPFVAVPVVDALMAAPPVADDHVSASLVDAASMAAAFVDSRDYCIHSNGNDVTIKFSFCFNNKNDVTTTNLLLPQ